MANQLQTISPRGRDAQAATPVTPVSLSRVGVTGVEKIIRVCNKARVLRAERGATRDMSGGEADEESLYHADLECFVDLNPEQAGVHMSRFEEEVNEAIDTVVLGEALRAEGLAAHIAERVRGRQAGRRAEVRIAARYPETVPAPVSGSPTKEPYTPCAQGLVEEGARERLAEHGFTPDEIDRIVDTVPLATHNQRGIGTLYIGVPEDSSADIDARQLLRIVETSMSSEIYELMKRSDERAVVEKAHANPRFVEDCVREMIRQVTAIFPDLRDGTFVQARQENLETIHRHNVIAERYGLLAEIIQELDSGAPRATTPPCASGSRRQPALIDDGR